MACDYLPRSHGTNKGGQTPVGIPQPWACAEPHLLCSSRPAHGSPSPGWSGWGLPGSRRELLIAKEREGGKQSLKSHCQVGKCLGRSTETAYRMMVAWGGEGGSMTADVSEGVHRTGAPGPAGLGALTQQGPPTPRLKLPLSLLPAPPHSHTYTKAVSGRLVIVVTSR